MMFIWNNFHIKMIWFSYDTCDRFLILFCIISYQCIYYIRIISFWYKNCIWQNLIWVKGNFIWIWELTMRIDFCCFYVGPMKAEEVDPRLLIPVCDRLCCYLPWSVRRHFYCGAEYQTEVSTAHMYMWYVSCTGGTKNVPFFQIHHGVPAGHQNSRNMIICTVFWNSR